MNNEQNVEGVNVSPAIAKPMLAAVIVGQKVWVKPSSLWRSRKEPFEATVSKVGRKYFELTECPREKYDLETLRQVTETNYENKVYLQLQDILDEKEHLRLSDEIRRAFNGYGKLQYSLEQLRKIAEVVGLQ